MITLPTRYRVQTGKHDVTYEAETCQEAAQQLLEDFTGPYGQLVQITGPDGDSYYVATERLFRDKNKEWE